MDSIVIVPIVFFVFGVLSVIFPERLGIGFCRLGKTIWKIGTFGFTDMRWFYPEDKAPRIFRTLGILFIVVSLPFFAFWFGVGSGPNSFTAMNQAKSYLRSHFGKSSTWSISTRENTINSEDPTVGHCLIEFEYAGHSGVLRGTWTTDERFVFEKYKVE